MTKVKVKVLDIGRTYLVLRWQEPLSGRWLQKSAGTNKIREAQKLAGQLEAELDEGRYVPPTRIKWEDFRERYEAEALPNKSPRTGEIIKAIMNHIERLMRPKRLADLDANAISVVQSRLRAEGLQDSTIAGHVGHLRSALSWAVSMGMLPSVPRIHRPRKAKGVRMSRGRPVTDSEFDRMLAVTDLVRPRDAANWRRLLVGLWLSGLRLGEAQALSWEDSGEIAVDLSGECPCLRIWAEAEKGRRDRQWPLTPDFATWLLETPEANRTGRVQAANAP